MLVLAGLALLAFYQQHRPYLVQLLAVFLTASLVLAIRQNSWIWDGIIVVGLSIAVFQTWSEGKRPWAAVYLTTVLLALFNLFRKLRHLMPRQDVRQWPLTKGGFSGNYEDGGERVIYYGYEVGGSYYSGYVPGGSVLKLRLKSQLDPLKGKPAFIRYKPDQPEVSTVLKSDQPELPA